MNSLYFGEAYFELGQGGINKRGYTQDIFLEHWGETIKFLISVCHPSRVVDIGCAKGFLTLELRRKGIEAYGVDASEYALSQAPDEIKPFLYQRDVSFEPFFLCQGRNHLYLLGCKE